MTKKFYEMVHWVIDENDLTLSTPFGGFQHGRFLFDLKPTQQTLRKDGRTHWIDKQGGFRFFNLTEAYFIATSREY